MNNIQTYINSMKMNSYQTNKGNLGKGNNSISGRKEIINKQDSIEINEKNSLLINTKKACDALEATSREIGKTSWGGYEYVNNNDYLGFIEKMEEFVKTDPDLKDDYPDKFFDFTKLFKEKLLQFGCK